MYVTQVTDKRTGVTYRLDRQLGKGATAEVWLGASEGDASAAPVAVKVALPGTRPEELAEFEDELALPALLAAHGVERHLPWMSRGYAPAAPQAFCTIMEYIPDAWQLSQLAAEAGGRLPEHLALQSGLQFAELLQGLHAATFTMRGDRKATDFRWDESAQRLVVIDWNRAARIPASATLALREALLLQDIRVFGQVWSELLLGRAVAELPAVDDLQDPGWAGISRGLRCILFRALSPRMGHNYTDAATLKRDIAEQLSAFDKLQEGNLETLVGRAEQAQASANEAPPAQRLAWVNQALNLCDLATRARDASAYASRIKQVAAWGTDQLASMDNRIDQAVAQIDEELALDRYREAAQKADEAINELSDLGPEARPAILRLMRWRSIPQVGLAGNEHGKNMGAVVSFLRLLVRELEDMRVSSTGDTALALRIQDAAKKLDEHLRRLPEPVRALAQPLAVELALRGKLESSLRAQANSVASVATQDATQVRSLWEQLYTHDNLYADHLRAALPELDRLLRRDEHGRAIGEVVEQYQNELQEAESDLSIALRQQGSAWPALSEPLARAWSALRALGQLRPAEQRLPQADSFVYLSQINDLVGQGSLIDALAIVDRLPNDSLVGLARRRIVELALAHIDRMLASQGAYTWLDEIEQAEGLLAASEHGRLPSIAHMRIAADVKKLRSSYDDLSAAVKPLLLAPLRLLEPGDDDAQRALDQALDEAAEKRIELIDRRTLPASEVERFRVANLRQLRALRRTSAYHTRRIAELFAQVREVADGLRGEAESLENSHRRLNSLLRQHDEYRASGAQERVTHSIDSMRAQMDAFEAMMNSLPSQDALNELERQVNEQQSRLENVTKIRGRIEQAAKNWQEFTSSVQAAEQPIAAALYSMWCTLGMQAAGELDLDGAREHLGRLQTWRRSAGPTFPDDQETHLRTTIVELEPLAQDAPLWNSLKEWHKAIKDKNIDQARTCAARLTEPFRQNPARFQSWVLDLARARHRELCGEDIGQVPLRPAESLRPTDPRTELPRKPVAAGLAKPTDMRALIDKWVLKSSFINDVLHDEFNNLIAATWRMFDSGAAELTLEDWKRLDEAFLRALNGLGSWRLRLRFQGDRDKIKQRVDEIEKLSRELHQLREQSAE